MQCQETLAVLHVEALHVEATPARNVSGKVAANTCPCISAVASADFAAARCSMRDLSLFATAVAIAI